LSCTFNCD